MPDNSPEPVGAFGPDGNWKKTRRVWIPEIDTHADAELERLARKLDLEHQGAVDGRDDKPPYSDTGLNQIQLAVCAHVHSGIHRLNQFLDEQVGSAVQTARELAPEPVDSDEIQRAVTRQVKAIFQSHRSGLVDLKKSELDESRGLRLFMHQNRLSRTAHYEESVVKVAAFVFGVFVLESVINGFLFSQVVSNGLMGGIILAGMISLVNVGSGILAGHWGWRYAGHVKTPLKVAGAVGAVFLHGVAIFWNFVVAHFREVAENFVSRSDFDFDIGQISHAVTAHINQFGLFGIESVQSWALLFLGLLIHFISAKEGWDDFADRYPDYKKFHLREKRSHAAFVDAMGDLRDQVQETIEEIEDTVKTKAASIRRACHDIAELLDVAEQRCGEVADSEHEWVNGGNRLLKIYREANLKIRDKSTTPAYFGTYPTAEEYRSNRFADSASGGSVTEHKRCVEKSLQELRNILKHAEGVREGAESTQRDIHRFVTRSLKQVDKRLEDEALNIRNEADAPYRNNLAGLDESPATAEAHT